MAGLFNRAAWREKNRDHIRAYFAKYRETYDRHGKEYVKRAKSYMLTNARRRAIRAGVPFTIEIGDIVVPTHCPVLGIPIKIGQGRVCDNSPSLDRTVPERGYVPGNIRVISFRANTIKSNATVEELRKVADYLEGATP